MDKSLLTNLIALTIILLSLVSPHFQAPLFSIGIFALSGAITNYLAVHMLFERVPLLYGSGVIPNRFEAFRGAIKEMIMEQFFTRENVNRFLVAEESSIGNMLDVKPVLQSIDYDRIFQSLLDVIKHSSLGGVLSMVGGTKVLEGLRDPFKEKVSTEIGNMIQSDKFQRILQSSVNNDKLSEDIIEKISLVLESRLAELTPAMVKEMVQTMIRQHLGWLVVWGGFFGGIIGLIVSLIP
ncbi:MAG TPA: DUF445 domain-containing protein [Gammaproteobacteria bacterium]|nr:DUF445 domain-containing protein [Gammaproteobacteria bacterium]